MTSKALEVAGFEVLTAVDGQEGLTKARLGRPDLILLDLMMPKLNGMEVLAALKQDAALRTIPVIIFTAKGQEMDEKLCREIGASAYLSKPHSSQELIERIAALLGVVLPQSIPPPP